jgi:hypothetical protein
MRNLNLLSLLLLLLHLCLIYISFLSRSALASIDAKCCAMRLLGDDFRMFTNMNCSAITTATTLNSEFSMRACELYQYEVRTMERWRDRANGTAVNKSDKLLFLFHIFNSINLEEKFKFQIRAKEEETERVCRSGRHLLSARSHSCAHF